MWFVPVRSNVSIQQLLKVERLMRRSSSIAKSIVDVTRRSHRSCSSPPPPRLVVPAWCWPVACHQQGQTRQRDRALLAVVKGSFRFLSSISKNNNTNNSSCSNSSSTLSSSSSSSSRFQSPRFSSVAAELYESDSEDEIDESVDWKLKWQQQPQRSFSMMKENRGTYSTEETNQTSLSPQHQRHCETCTCEQQQQQPLQQNKSAATASDALAGNPLAGPTGDDTEQQRQPFPPPLPEPLYSVRRRLLSSEWTVALQSEQGQERLLQSLQQQTAASYIALTQHFLNQAEPAYCAITTACMVLNALEIDSVWRWKGGWRYYASEEVLLAHCQGCWSTERLQRVGMTAEEFQKLVTCQGLDSTFQRPHSEASNTIHLVGATHTTAPIMKIHDESQQKQQSYSLDNFRSDVQMILTNNSDSTTTTTNTRPRRLGIMVVSFCRSTLGQTGDGHFSPIAAYHKASDSVLVLDVARYKYPPYWVELSRLYQAMQPCDSVTGKPRGWFLLYNHNSNQHDRRSQYKSTGSSDTEDSVPANGKDYVLGENRRPAHLVPVVGRDSHPCPMHQAQVQYCPNHEKMAQTETKTTFRSKG